MQEIISEYVAAERDASAYAIRVIRALRKQGFDLEPELKTITDFKAIVHESLASYQLIADNLGLDKMSKQFLATKKSKAV